MEKCFPSWVAFLAVCPTGPLPWAVSPPNFISSTCLPWSTYLGCMNIRKGVVWGCLPEGSTDELCGRATLACAPGPETWVRSQQWCVCLLFCSGPNVHSVYNLTSVAGRGEWISCIHRPSFTPKYSFNLFLSTPNQSWGSLGISLRKMRWAANLSAMVPSHPVTISLQRGETDIGWW